MVVEGRGRAMVAFAFFIIMMIISLLLSAAFLKLHRSVSDDEPNPDKEKKGVFLTTRTSQDEGLLMFKSILGHLLVNICLRIFAIWKLCQSLIQCEKNPREALKSVETVLDLEVGMLITWGLTFFFIPLAFIEFIFIYSCTNEFRKDLLKMVSGPGTAPMMLPVVSPSMMGQGKVAPAPMPPITDSRDDNNGP